MLTRADRWLVLIALAGVLLGILFVQYLPFGGPGEEVVIEVDGEEEARYSWEELEDGQRLSVSGPLGDSIVEIDRAGERVRMYSSPCPDDICVHTGWIQEPGQSVVCLPNRVVIRLEEGPETPDDGLDGVTY